MNTHNSISAELERLMRVEKNMLALLTNLTKAAVSSNEQIELEFIDDLGNVTKQTIPSVGYLFNLIKQVERNQRRIAGLDNGKSQLRLSDGTIHSIIVAAAKKDPAPIKDLQVPVTFGARSNWFFENFLNPLLFVKFDFNGRVEDDVRKAVVRRYIIQAITDQQKEFFDFEIKGKNDITVGNLLRMLSEQQIQVFTDEEVKDFPPSPLRHIGTFDVSSILDQEVLDVLGNKVMKKKYRLNKLTYTDTLSNVRDGMLLTKGDRILCGESVYLVDDVDNSENSIIANRLVGNDVIKIGADMLTIYNAAEGNKVLEVSVGHDERQVVFIKPVDQDNITSAEWSNGIGFYSNELNITSNGKPQTLDTYYRRNVSDIGQQLLSSAKDRFVSAVNGVYPDAPILDVSNFKVVNINDHKKDEKLDNLVQTRVAEKLKVQSDISNLTTQIDAKKSELDFASKSTLDRLIKKEEIDKLTKNKTLKTSLLASIARELASNTNTQVTPKSRVRGFFAIPNAKISAKTEPQEVIQFKISYRYLRKDGRTPGTEQIDYTDGTTTKRGFFSNWVEVKTDVRNRVYNDDTGYFVWDDENTEDPEKVNINQIDIPITDGEKVEIRVKSISEAGWPMTPLESEWSKPITIGFPETVDSALSTDTAQQAQLEEAKLSLLEGLNGVGLDRHLSTSRISNDKYFAHDTIDISSGFYTAEGKAIPLFEKLITMDNELKRLQALIEKAKGSLSLSIVDSRGNVTKITPNQTLQLFAGYYKDLIKNGENLDHGKVVTKIYTLRLENTAASDLVLGTNNPGGQNKFVQASEGNQDREKMLRKYDKATISYTGMQNSNNTGFEMAPPFQSGQELGRFLYGRGATVGFDYELYNKPKGKHPHQTMGKPNTTAGAKDNSVWNGAYPVQGNGTLSEFCVHIDHPNITDLYTKYQEKYGLPDLEKEALRAPYFFHSTSSSIDDTDPNGFKQDEFFKTIPYKGGPTVWENIAGKLGFYQGDEYLIGKKTCGAYLFLAPSLPGSLTVDATNDSGKRVIPFNQEKIEVPIVFQFRLTDILGHIGGWRSAGQPRNITYRKKIGLDIQIKDDQLVSFDVEVFGKYEADSMAEFLGSGGQPSSPNGVFTSSGTDGLLSR